MFKNCYRYVVIVLAVCCATSAGQQPQIPLPEPKSSSDDHSNQMRIISPKNVEVSELVRVFRELRFVGNTAVSIHPNGGALVLYGPTSEVEVLGNYFKALDTQATEGNIPKSLGVMASFVVEYPKGVTVRWVGGQGGITHTGTGTICHSPAGGITKLWFSKIPNQETHTVEATVEVREIPAQTAAILASNPAPFRLTVDDIEQVASGKSITKLLVGPNDVSSGKDLFDQIVSYRMPAGSSSISDLEKQASVLAVIRMTGGKRDQDIPSDILQKTTPLDGSSAINAVQTAPIESNIKNLTDEFADTENRITSLAEQFRSTDEIEPAKAQGLATQLRAAVTQAFNLRQQLQLAQIEFQRAKLDALSVRIKIRENSSKQIIDQRVETLSANGTSANLQKPKSNPIEPKK